MNFKSLALATTLAITSLVTGTAVEASSGQAQAQAIVDRHEALALEAYNRQDWDTMCRHEGTMIYMNFMYPGVLSPKFEAQTQANHDACISQGRSVATLESAPRRTQAFSAQTEALFGAMTTGGNSGRTYTFAEAKKYCLGQDSYDPRPEYDTFTGEATGYWECGHGNGTSGGRIRMAR